jgi:predicted DCC family thiol-disulfide oxidoreductase YuxK
MTEAIMCAQSTLIIYDGECVFCQNFVRLVRLREAVGRVELIDARSGDPRVAAYQRQGVDLNEGMLVVWNERIYHGAEAVHVLGGLSNATGWVNRFNRAIFSRRVASQFIYPLLKLGRRVTLAVRGKSLIKPPS